MVGRVGEILDARFMRSQVNQAVYFIRRKGEEHTVITVSVDDMAITSRHPWHISEFKVQLQTRLKISDLGELSWILGLKVERNHQALSIALSQKAYVETILEHFRLQDAKSMHISMHSGSVFSINNLPPLLKNWKTCKMFPTNMQEDR